MRDPRGRRAILALPAALAFALSVAASWVPSFWHDEAATISAVTRPIPKLLDLLQNVDAVHGLYYLLLEPWVALFGTSEFAVRLPSAVAIAAATLGICLIADRLVGLRAAVYAGLVFAILPVSSHFGMEARSYALVCALATWATYVFLRAVDRESEDGAPWKLWAAYGVLVFLASAFFVYALLIPAAHCVTLIAARQPRRVLLRFLGVVGLAVLAVSPLLLLAIGQTGQISYLARTFPGSPWLAPFVWITPRLFEPQALFGAIVIAVAVLLWASGVYAVVGWVTGRRAPDSPERSPGTVGLVSLTVPWLLLPAFALVNASALIQPVYASRYVFYSMPALAILVGYALALLPRRSHAVAALVLLTALAIPILVADRQPDAKDDLRQVSAIIADNKQPGDAIVFQPATRRRMRAAYPDGFYGLDDVLLQVAPEDNDTLTGQEFPRRELPAHLAGVSRVWLVQYAVIGESDPDRTREALDAAGFEQDRTWSDGRADVFLYVRRR